MKTLQLLFITALFSVGPSWHAYSQATGNQAMPSTNQNWSDRNKDIGNNTLRESSNASFSNRAFGNNVTANSVGAVDDIVNVNPGAQPGNPPNQLNVGEPNNNSVVLEADVLINVKATSYVAIFAVNQEGRNVSATDSGMNARLETFMSGLTKIGIPTENVHVDFICLIPSYGIEVVNKKLSNNAHEVPTGFQMKKNIHVIFENHQDLDDIITSAAGAEIYDVVKVDYNIDNIKAAYDTLRVEATKIIANKRGIYHNMGLDTKVVNMNEGYSVSYPIERYDGYVAYYADNSEEQAVNDNPNLNIRRSNKVETIFYNKIAYNQFDMVLNANSVEPMVQFYYKLKVRYVVSPKPEKKPEDLTSDNAG
jgi:uncharacterized protein YggE